MLKVTEILDTTGAVTLARTEDNKFLVGIGYQVGTEINEPDPHVDFCVTTDEYTARLNFNHYKDKP